MKRASLLVLFLAALAAGGASATTARAAPRYAAKITRLPPALRHAMVGRSWHEGCPVALADLRLITLRHWDFTGAVRKGRLVVNRDVARPVARAFGALFRQRFPIRRIRPVDAYGGDDFRSIEDDNTSAFNCRSATGSSHWSEHAYGHAVDLDPLENPYLQNGKTSHRGSRRYVDRSGHLPGMIHAGDATVSAFAAIGWGWGGSWSGSVQDYQHFSLSGS